MAGKAVGRFEAAIGFVGVLALTVTLAITTGWNPGTAFMGWLDRVTSISEPAPTWHLRLGGRPTNAGFTNSAQMIVASPGLVEAYHLDQGGLIWRHEAPWGTAAGDVAVIGRNGRGYAVVDPASGAIIWEETQAAAVWAYTDILLDLTCPNASGCTLRARGHRDNGDVLWSVPLPGNGRKVTGLDPDLLDTRSPAGWAAPAANGAPGEAPSVIALAIDGHPMVVDLVEGRLARQLDPPGQLTRVSVAGGRLVVTRSLRGNDGCRFEVEGIEFLSGTSVWSHEGYNLDTADQVGCEQRREPLGSGGMLSAVRGDNHPVLLDAADGSERWAGEVGERVLATDGSLAVIESADRRHVRVLDLLDSGRQAWTAQLGENPEAAITPTAVLVHDRDKNRLLVLSRAGTVLRDLKTDADLIGYGRDGIVLANGRTVGVVRFTQT
jgi:outer membrane protein assembly factor BamB